MFPRLKVADSKNGRVANAVIVADYFWKYAFVQLPSYLSYLIFGQFSVGVIAAAHHAAITVRLIGDRKVFRVYTVSPSATGGDMGVLRHGSSGVEFVGNTPRHDTRAAIVGSDCAVAPGGFPRPQPARRGFVDFLLESFSECRRFFHEIGLLVRRSHIVLKSGG